MNEALTESEDDLEGTEDYQQSIEDIIRLTPVIRSDIFEYHWSPYKAEFNDAFNFYRETLRINESYGVKPSFVFFRDLPSVNAGANKTNGCYLVNINKGTITKLISTFRKKPDLLREVGDEGLIAFEKVLDTPVTELMYQTAVHFTFYHELGHLIQMSDALEDELDEQLDDKASFDIEKHNQELDADEFSAISIGAHLVQYAQNMFGREFTSEQLEKVLVIGCSAVLIYLLSFETNKVDLYYEQYSHPHPVIRITSIVFVITDYSLQTLTQLGFELQLDPKQVINKTLALASRICRNESGENPVERYRSYLEAESKNITSYLQKMNALRQESSSYAFHKWNVMARKLHG